MKHLMAILITTATILNCFAQKSDVAGSKDHPVVGRFRESYIRFYEFNKFNLYSLRISPIRRGYESTAKRMTIEGAVTRIVYQCPKTVSAYEAYKSYENALLNRGFEKIFACETNDCGDGFGRSYPSDNAPHISTYTQDQRYFAGKRQETDSSDLYVAVYTVFTQDGPVVRLDIVEVRSMEENQVVVSSVQIKNDIDRIGKAIISQIYFESGKATLLPSSEPALREIANFLKTNPALKVYIVGHTDNSGTLEFNLSLSQQRADAVIQELTRKYGIEASRLIGRGVGFLCPVASNDSDKGKARNRRVEIVKQ